MSIWQERKQKFVPASNIHSSSLTGNMKNLSRHLSWADLLGSVQKFWKFSNKYYCFWLDYSPFQLDLFIAVVRNARFRQVNSAFLLCWLKQRSIINYYKYVYLLLMSVLILPEVTATVKRVFSAMNKVRNRMGDNIWMIVCWHLSSESFSYNLVIMMWYLTSKARRLTNWLQEKGSKLFWFEHQINKRNS